MDFLCQKSSGNHSRNVKTCSFGINVFVISKNFTGFELLFLGNSKMELKLSKKKVNYLEESQNFLWLVLYCIDKQMSTEIIFQTNAIDVFLYYCSYLRKIINFNNTATNNR